MVKTPHTPQPTPTTTTSPETIPQVVSGPIVTIGAPLAMMVTLSGTGQISTVIYDQQQSPPADKPR